MPSSPPVCCRNLRFSSNLRVSCIFNTYVLLTREEEEGKSGCSFNCCCHPKITFVCCLLKGTISHSRATGCLYCANTTESRALNSESCQENTAQPFHFCYFSFLTHIAFIFLFPLFCKICLKKAKGELPIFNPSSDDKANI